MTNSAIDLASFMFSDPRVGQRREFKLTSSETVSNSELELVIFECDTYAVYSDSAQVALLVMAAIHSQSQPLLLASIRPRPHNTSLISAIPSSWKLLYNSDSELRYLVTKPTYEELRSGFEEVASCERWSFAIPAHKLGDENLLDPALIIDFEQGLRESAKWRFLITIDLDSMLLGFVHASRGFDAFYSQLTHEKFC